MSGVESIRETCACGATFEFVGRWSSLYSARWRRDHQHIPPSEPDAPAPPADAARTATTQGPA